MTPETPPKMQPGMIRAHALPFLAVLLAAALYHGHPFPWENERVYLTIPRVLFDNGFLANDWLFRETWRSHLIFDLLAGKALGVVSTETLAAAGRTLSWTLTFGLMFRLGGLLGLSRWMTAGALVFWLIHGQALLSGAWIIGGFEAKSIAYILVFAALTCQIRNRTIPAAVCLGLCFSFHPAVGMFTILAGGMTLVALKQPVKQILLTVVITFVTALPGILCLVPVLSGESSLNLEDTRFLTRTLMPFHLDPFSWPKRQHVNQIILLAFNTMVFWRFRHLKPVRFLFIFLACLGIFFGAGVAARAAQWDGLLIYFPFRLFPLFLLLTFFLFLAHTLLNLDRKNRYLVIAGVVAVMCLDNSLGRVVDTARHLGQCWENRNDDIAVALDWVRDHTPGDAVILAPTWRKDAWYRSGRAQAVNAMFFPYDHRVTEFRRRLAMIYHDHQGPLLRPAIREGYENLSPEDVRAIAVDLKAGYFLALKDYPFALVHRSGICRVYALP